MRNSDLLELTQRNPKFSRQTKIIVGLSLLMVISFLIKPDNVVGQIASGGNYSLIGGTVSSGGGTASDQNSRFRLHQLLGEAVAGDTSNGGNYQLRSGLFGFAQFIATSANVQVQGRVVDTRDGGLGGVIVLLSTGDEPQPRQVRTSTLGYFTFDDVEVGRTYLVTVVSRRHGFAEATKVVAVFVSVTDLVFRASWEN